MQEYDPRHFKFYRQSGIPRGQLGSYRKPSSDTLRRVIEIASLIGVAVLFYFAVQHS